MSKEDCFSVISLQFYPVHSLSRGLSTVGHTGTFMLDMSNALGDESSTQAGEILSEQVMSLIKESPHL